MKVTIEFIGMIDKGPYNRVQEFDDVPEGISILKFLESLHFGEMYARYILAIRDGEVVQKVHPLLDGDYLQLQVPAGGG